MLVYWRQRRLLVRAPPAARRAADVSANSCCICMYVVCSEVVVQMAGRQSTAGRGGAPVCWCIGFGRACWCVRRRQLAEQLMFLLILVVSVFTWCAVKWSCRWPAASRQLGEVARRLRSASSRIDGRRSTVADSAAARPLHCGADDLVSASRSQTSYMMPVRRAVHCRAYSLCAVAGAETAKTATSNGHCAASAARPTCAR